LNSARRFEFGTRNLADQAGFGKALDLWQEIGWHKVFATIGAYTDRLKAALQTVPALVLETPLPYEQSAGIVTFSLPGLEAASISAGLMEHERVLVSCLEHDNSLVRVSTHVFNTDEEIERLVAGLYRLRVGGYQVLRT
jgi:selenocysteine lyase/cysteine desulfurase